MHRISRRARVDLEDIWLYVATEAGNERLADSVVDAIAHRFLLLAEHPRIGRRRHDDLGLGVRSFPVGNYIILYEIVGPDVHILRVVHGARDLASLIGRAKMF